ncbi:MAG: NADH-ubiquinone oxidoreductase chain J [Ignavibacteriae bacterium]|nr:MAG: NADH-ubiquinone oxidoreductase chain J [Ignavibacteriota bacterium]
MNIDTVVFFVLSGAAILSAILVITRRSPIMSVVFLIANFIILAIIYLTLYAQFIAVIQIIVYAGAIMVLFLFVIMLLNLAKDEQLKEELTYRKRVGIGLVVVLVVQLGVGLFVSVGKHPDKLAANAEKLGTVESIGKILFTEYLLPFEITSILLLVGLIGAVVLAKKRIG